MFFQISMFIYNNVHFILTFKFKLNIKKAIIISFLGSVIYLLFGWFVFDFVLGEYTGANTTAIEGFKKSEEEYSFLCLYTSCLAYAVLLNYILVLLTNTQDLLQGFLRAAVIGVLVAVMTDTYWYGSSHFYNNLLVMLVDICAAAITVGVLGLSIVWLNTKLSKHS